MLFSRTVAEYDFCFLIYPSIKWQWFTHYGQICFWRGNISPPKLGSPAFCQDIYNPLELLISAIVLLRELPCIPSSSSQRSCFAIVLVMPCPWRRHTLFFLRTHRLLWSVWALWPGSLCWIRDINLSPCSMGKSTEPLELDLLPSGLASVAYYTGSPTRLHIGLSWGKFKNSIYAGSHPRDSDVIALEWPWTFIWTFKTPRVVLPSWRCTDYVVMRSYLMVLGLKFLYMWNGHSNPSPVVGVPTLLPPQHTCTALPLPSPTVTHRQPPPSAPS